MSGDLFQLDDPWVVDLTTFMQDIPLSDGTRTRIHFPGQSGLVAQSILNWINGLVYEGGEWLPRAEVESIPDFGEVEMTTLSDGVAVKMRHLPTGVVALGEDAPEALKELRRKVLEVKSDA